MECFIGISCCFRFLLVPVALRAVANGQVFDVYKYTVKWEGSKLGQVGAAEVFSGALSLLFFGFCTAEFLSLICCLKLSGCVTVTVTLNLELETMISVSERTLNLLALCFCLILEIRTFQNKIM